MKNSVKWLCAIALVAVIGFSLAACGQVKLEGTMWKAEEEGEIVFNSPTNMTFIDDGTRHRGTYTISGNKVTIDLDGEILTGKVSGNKLTLSEEGDDDVLTFTKQ